MKIENYREEPSSNLYTVALFDLYLPNIGLTFQNLKLNKAKKGHHYISFPSFMHSEDPETGRKIFKPYYFFSDEKQKEFERKIMDELSYLVKGGIVRNSL